MVNLTQGNPALFPLIGDLMIRSMDWPMAEEIADRLKLMLPSQILQSEKEKDGGPGPEVQAIMQQAQQAMQQKDAMMQQAMQKLQELAAENQQLKADQAAKQAELQIRAQETQIKAQETAIKGFDAETKRMQAEASAETERMQLMIAAQQPEQPEAPQESAKGGEINDILQTIATMGNPIHVGVPDAMAAQTANDAAIATAQAADRIQGAVEALTQVAMSMAQPKHKKGKAVRQADGSYIMESIEEQA
jgi:hypothetical protein